MPTLTASTPSAISASVAFRGRDVAGDEIDVREAAAQRAHHVEHALRVAVRGVDDEHVDVGGDQRVGALDRVARDADRRAAAQPAERILRRVRVLDRLLDVLDGDQPLQPEVAVDDEQLLDLVLVQDLARRVERRADRHGEERLARHHVGDRAVDVGLEAQIAVGEDADQPPFLAAVLGDRHAGDAVLLHQVERFEDPVGGGERDRIDDHAALRALDAIDFRRLLLDRQVLVDDAEAALLRHRDRQPRLGDGVHRRADQRHVQPDVARELRADVDLRRQDSRSAAARAGCRRRSARWRGRIRWRGAKAFRSVFTRPPRDTSCISSRCRTGRDRCGRPSARRAARS